MAAGAMPYHVYYQYWNINVYTSDPPQVLPSHISPLNMSAPEDLLHTLPSLPLRSTEL